MTRMFIGPRAGHRFGFRSKIWRSGFDRSWQL